MITSFLSLGSFISKSAIALVIQVEEISGEVLYRSQVKLDDQLGKVWPVVLFT
ncbi:DUF3122 domain-containing protein [Trichormus azollae]|uniref:DUF3122 domain-containing protein n=1 Tax=Trichormus azollae TaxID=1164 RepID=UPI00325CD717